MDRTIYDKSGIRVGVSNRPVEMVSWGFTLHDNGVNPHDAFLNAKEIHRTVWMVRDFKLSFHFQVFEYWTPRLLLMINKGLCTGILYCNADILLLTFWRLTWICIMYTDLFRTSKRTQWAAVKEVQLINYARGRTIKFANSPTCAFRGSTGQIKSQNNVADFFWY